MVIIRPEEPFDRAAVFDANAGAFGRRDEARLVDALRGVADPFISLVAVESDQVVGHVLCTPVTVHDEATGEAVPLSALGLGPVAVAPGRQNRGIGTHLVRTSLEACLAAGRDVVFVVGHPTYYPRFGFRPAKPLGLRWEHDVPDDVFVVAELAPGALRGVRGVVKYHPAFAGV